MANRERTYLSVPVTPRKRQEIRTAALEQNTSMVEWIRAAIEERLNRQRHGVSDPPFPGKSKGNRKFSDDEEREIAERYRTEKTVDLARELGISEATVVAIARRQGVYKRQPGLGLDQETRDDITARYSAGEAVASIAKAYGLSQRVIHDIAVSNGVQRRSVGPGRRRKLSPSKEATIAKRYQQGERSVDIAAEYGIRQELVYKIARRNGVKVQRSRKKMIEERPIDLDTAEEIAKLYAVGQSATTIAEKYKIDPARVKDIVKSVGISPSRKGKKSRGFPRSKVTTRELRDWAAENGVILPRGRVPDWLIAKYQERPLDPATRGKIITRVSRGASVQDVARDYRITPERVTQIVAGNNP